MTSRTRIILSPHTLLHTITSRITHCSRCSLFNGSSVELDFLKAQEVIFRTRRPSAQFAPTTPTRVHECKGGGEGSIVGSDFEYHPSSSSASSSVVDVEEAKEEEEEEEEEEEPPFESWEALWQQLVEETFKTKSKVWEAMKQTGDRLLPSGAMRLSIAAMQLKLRRWYVASGRRALSLAIALFPMHDNLIRELLQRWELEQRVSL